eukprot:4791484-Pyramimonas_sp.AAC.1
MTNSLEAVGRLGISRPEGRLRGFTECRRNWAGDDSCDDNRCHRISHMFSLVKVPVTASITANVSPPLPPELLGCSAGNSTPEPPPRGSRDSNNQNLIPRKDRGADKCRSQEKN